MLKAVNLYKQFENDEIITKVLFDINFEIKDGEFVAIMGPSGSGKSTLMHILGLLDRPTIGKYFLDKEDTSRFSDEKLARLRNKKIGFIFQSFNLLPKTTLLDNVKLPLQYNKEIKNKDKAATDVLKAVNLEHRLKYFSNQISGGEKQRVAIARSLVCGPQIIFADEPTGNLDSKSGEQVMQILSNLNLKGKTIILVTHEQYTAEYAMRIIKLKDGRVISDEHVKNRRKNGLVK